MLMKKINAIRLKKAEDLYLKALELKKNNKFTEAEKIFKIISKTFKQHHSTDSLEKYCDCLNKLGAIYIYFGHFSDASSYLK